MNRTTFDTIPADIIAIGTRAAAQRLDCSRRHIRKLIHDQRIRSWLISSRVSIVDRREIEAYEAYQVNRRLAGDRRGSLPQGFKPDVPPNRQRPQ